MGSGTSRLDDSGILPLEGIQLGALNWGAGVWEGREGAAGCCRLWGVLVKQGKSRFAWKSSGKGCGISVKVVVMANSSSVAVSWCGVGNSRVWHWYSKCSGSLGCNLLERGFPWEKFIYLSSLLDDSREDG